LKHESRFLEVMT